jgi:uncharacterized protein HemY
MTLIGWILWILTALVFAMFAIESLDGPRLIRIGRRIISLGLLAVLVGTVATGVSKLHLLWLVPVVVFGGRALAGFIVYNQTRRRVQEHLADIEEHGRGTNDG